jgi:hypothetical protein
MRLPAPIASVLAAACATALAIGLAGSAAAKTPVEISKRLADLKQIEIHPGLTRIRDAEGDGRDAQVFNAWRDNGNAWGFNVYIVTMPRRAEDGRGPDWQVVGIGIEPKGGLAAEATDRPHTGEDALTSVRFARGRLDGKAATLLVIASRDPKGAVPDPAETTIRILALKNAEDQGAGTTPDVFETALTFTTTATYSSTDEALLRELGLPLPKFD